MAAIGIITGLLWIAQWLSWIGIGCFVYKSTGLHCPGCGGTRCARDLVAGNWLQALDHNALLTVGALGSAALCIYLIVRVTILGKPTPKLPGISSKWLWAGFLLIVLFTVLRNIPAFHWLAP